MFQAASKKRLGGEGGNDYATQSDFCNVFQQQLDSLLLLALLLTGDELSAEKCFLDAFESCAQERLVFKESALGWSKRSVIKNAIRLMSPAPSDSPQSHFPGNGSNLGLDQNASLKRVQELPLFERFVYVMSVLERYSDHECALLLGYAFTDILPARIRAFQQIARLERSYPVHRSDTLPYVIDADWLECG